MKKYSKLFFSLKEHSFKHLYRNYSVYALVDYYNYLQKIHYNIFNYYKILSSADKSCLTRSIIDLEKSIIFYLLGGV